jgi:hypothetical protein
MRQEVSWHMSADEKSRHIAGRVAADAQDADDSRTPSVDQPESGRRRLISGRMRYVHACRRLIDAEFAAKKGQSGYRQL